MPIAKWLLGKPLRSDEQESEKIGTLSAIPILGLDALSSAAYGPEAALTVLLPLGLVGVAYVLPITLVIVVLLVIVQFSYRQTIAAYPDGGGSYTVAKENLGVVPSLLAASALSLDYILNVAVGISAGVGALVSAFPQLLPHTLALCLLLLSILTVINLRGLREAGLLFMTPTYLFVGSLTVTVLLGIFKVGISSGHPTPVFPPPPLSAAVAVGSTWLLLRTFATGCTALTGVEAVSNAVPIFREPRVTRAQRTLAAIISMLVLLLAGIAFLCREYGIGATPPGQAGYQSVLSQLVAAVAGRGAFYYVAIGSIVVVLILSANTSFADFPRLCRILALDEFLPASFAHRGRRLVYSHGIVLLALLSALLLVVFRGITDRLIPLFAIGAFAAFTLSQAGMVIHWHRHRNKSSRHSQLVNGLGAIATGITLIVVIASKFTEGAWLSLFVIPVILFSFQRMRDHFWRVERQTVSHQPLNTKDLKPSIVVVPLKRFDRIARKAIEFALTMSQEICAVQILTENQEEEDLTSCWKALVEEPARQGGFAPPRLVVLKSEYRELIDPLFHFIQRLSKENSERHIAVLVPEMVERRWYHYVLHSHNATILKALLLFRGGPRIAVIDLPWYLKD